MNKIIPTPSYTYNKANQLVTSTVNGVTTHYKYDAAAIFIDWLPNPTFYTVAQ